ncbi:MAG: hypothetical protein ABTD50_18240 [Polyangiaceae bacterium]|jgi:hypothetical protein
MAIARASEVDWTRPDKVGLAVTALLLHGCGPPLPDCNSTLESDASMPGLVNDPFVGPHTGTLTWLETMTTTSVAVTISVAGPVWRNYDPSGSASCSGYTVALDMSVQTGDGLVQSPPQTASSSVPVDTDGGVEVSNLDITVDAARLLDGGVAPEQPNFASQTPRADLTISRQNDGAAMSGTLRVTGSAASVTIATLAF